MLKTISITFSLTSWILLIKVFSFYLAPSSGEIKNAVVNSDSVNENVMFCFSDFIFDRRWCYRRLRHVAGRIHVETTSASVRASLQQEVQVSYRHVDPWPKFLLTETFCQQTISPPDSLLKWNRSTKQIFLDSFEPTFGVLGIELTLRFDGAGALV